MAFKLSSTGSSKPQSILKTRVTSLHCSSILSTKNQVAGLFLNSPAVRRPEVTRRASAGDSSKSDGSQNWKEGRNDQLMPWHLRVLCMMLYAYPPCHFCSVNPMLLNYFPKLAFLRPWFNVNRKMYDGHEYAHILFFFAVYFLVFKNKRCPHLARFHILQSLTFDIGCTLFYLMLQSIRPRQIGSLGFAYFRLFVYINVLILCLYCFVHALLNVYCDIPIVSEGVYLQLDMLEAMDATGGSKNDGSGF